MTSLPSPPPSLFAKMGAFVHEGFFSPDECASLRADMLAAESAPASISRPGGTTIDETSRKTKAVQPSSASRRMVRDRFKSVLQDIANHFEVPLSSDQGPHFLLYEEGDFFVAHNDGNESSYADHCRARQVSAVVFLNDPDTEPDRFLGGELVLYGLVDRPEWEGIGMPFPAKTGTLLAFRSALWHEVKAVTEGRRCTVVTWYE